MKTIFAPAVAIAAILTFMTLPASAQTRGIDDIRVFAVYEPVVSTADVDLLRAAHPDLICRGWFRWNNARVWQDMAPLADSLREAGIVLQGGTTVSALYPRENGIDEATFLDFATRSSLTGEPYTVGGTPGWYQASIYNPKYMEYIKRDVRRQIDAGAEGIWYDEVEGYYDWLPTAGYDSYTLAAFRDWLIRKYVDGQGWENDDPRWRTVFGIDLARHGGTIRKFDYLQHLRTTMGADGKPLAANPPQGNPRKWAESPNPLHREWGFAWNRAAKGTFRFDTVATIFADLVADADRYAKSKYGRTLINTYNHNDTARPGVAFLQPHHGGQPPMAGGRLDGSVSYLAYYDKIIADARDAGVDVPVVFFVDWPGEADRLTALPRGDQLSFFAAYIPEAYAAGGEFALPLRGYSYISAQQDTTGYLARMADFYREYFPFLRGSTPVAAEIVAPEKVTARLRRTESGSVLHLVNHNVSAPGSAPRTLRDVVIDLPVPRGGMKLRGAYAVSPDWPEQRTAKIEVPITGTMRITLPELGHSALVLLPPSEKALRPVTGSAGDGCHIVADGARAMAIASGGKYTIWLPPSVKTLRCLETGETLEATNGASFAPASGPFTAGLLLDAFGVPIRNAAIRAGGKEYRTDYWGRYRFPMPSDGKAVAAAGKESLAFSPGKDFTAWRMSERTRTITDLAAIPGLGGFWANWADKNEADARDPQAIRVTRETHAGKAALRFDFLPVKAGWRNVNSGRFSTRGMSEIEMTWAGDGTAREVSVSFQALGGPDKQRFYRLSLPLAEKGWTTRRIALSAFKDDTGQPFDPDATGTAVFQLSCGPTPAETMTVRLHKVTLINTGPAARSLWTDAESHFDTVDVDRVK